MEHRAAYERARQKVTSYLRTKHGPEAVVLDVRLLVTSEGVKIIAGVKEPGRSRPLLYKAYLDIAQVWADIPSAAATTVLEKAREKYGATAGTGIFLLAVVAVQTEAVMGAAQVFTVNGPSEPLVPLKRPTPEAPTSTSYSMGMLEKTIRRVRNDND